MPWTETTRGRWQRPIGENEAMIKMIGDQGQRFGKDIWKISVTARFEVKPDDGSLNVKQMLFDGWKALRFHHPSIASFSDDRDPNIVVYEVPDAFALENWATESFVCIETNENPDDVVATLSPRRFTTLFYLPKHATVILAISHWHTDGVGAMHLLNEYARCVVEVQGNPNPAQLPWGEEVPRLVPSVEEALNLPTTPAPDVERIARDYLKPLGPPLPSPYKSGKTVVPKGTRQISLRLSRDETTELESACSRLGLCIEAALHASVAATAYSICPDQDDKLFISSLRQSLRPHLPTPLNSTAGAAGLYTSAYRVAVNASQSWLQNAKKYDAEYRRGATPELLSSRRQYALVMKEHLQKLTTPPPTSADGPPPPPPPSGLDISWVPDVPALVQPVHTGLAGSLRIRHVVLAVDLMSRHVFVFGLIFDGRLELNVAYNEGFYEEALAREVLDLTRRYLADNLSRSSGSQE
ncbi:hypothetical protein BDV10DRAFT_184973 [Aspergillus recurvatus]